MFIHPVHVIIFLSIVVLLGVTWTFISARRKPQIAARVGVTSEADSLHRRVAALEKIVTDPSVRLSREIDDLRAPD